MKKVKWITISMLLCSSVFVISSCDKNTASLDGAGQTLVKVVSDGADQFSGVAFAFTPSSSDLDLFVTEIRRDVPNSGELNKAITVTLTQDDAVRTAYNTAAGKNYIALPDNFYSILTTGITKSGTTWTIQFQPGEFSKALKLRVKRSLFSFTNQYAIPLKIQDPGGATVHGDNDKVILGFLAKNKYDGVYTMDGSSSDVINGALQSDVPIEAHLITAGANKVNLFLPDYASVGGYVYGLWTGTGYSFYGSFGVSITFDASDNVATVENYYGQPAPNGRYASLDVSGINRWNPSTKRLDVKYFMHQPASVPTPPHIRTSFINFFTYVGPR